jgi:glycosyltransferase involved in cell wall biosynthesis
MNYSKISIVTPSYNQEQFLERTILSVINQNYPNLEYIIIDGGSTDGSVDIIKKYQKYLAYWISERDSGQSEAINKGFQKATGEIYAYLNSDDILELNVLKRINEIFTTQKKLDLIYSNCKIIDENDHILRLSIALPFNLIEHLANIFAIPQPSTFWKRDVFDMVGGFNISNHTCMDGEFFAKAFKIGYEFKNFDEIWSSFRIHSNSKTGAKTKEFVKSYFVDQNKYFLEINANHKNNIFNKIFTLFLRIKYLPAKVIRIIKYYLKFY